MKVDIRDADALHAISPSALAAYARSAGWTKIDTFGDYSDVYSSNRLPEIVLPRTSIIADYARVVGRLVEIFADTAEIDQLSLYRDLVTADRDVIRIRAEDAEGGSVPVSHGIDMMTGARDMLLAAACSLDDPRPLYRAGRNRQANDFMKEVRWGQTEQGSFIATLLTPVIPPPMQLSLMEGQDFVEDPVARKITRRLAESLEATHSATENAILGEGEAFLDAVPSGASANLCEALVKLIDPFPILEVRLSWARTRKTDAPTWNIGFENDNVSILREAARVFREKEPKEDIPLSGFVQRLKRDESESDGTIALRTSIEGQIRSVTAVLKQADYEKAIRAHEHKSMVTAIGDLERYGQRWRLLNPRISSVVEYDEDNEV